ncbi:MAG: hypothetical protein ACLFP8_04185 [Alphaproteobacteria bacterium]
MSHPDELREEAAQDSSAHEGGSDQAAVPFKAQIMKPEPARGGGFVVYLNDFIGIDSSKRLPKFDNGHSLAYLAFDSRNKDREYVALVADHGQLPRWKFADSYETLSDVSFLRLLGHGVVFWPSAGKEQYAFVYDASVAECLFSLDGDVDQVSWRQSEIIDFLIAPMARVLKILEDRNFCHGSIRPDNIFHRNRERNKQVVLGDCLSVYPNASQPAMFMSVERASAEPFGRGLGRVKDDIYAFGVTLALFLRKGSAFEGLSDKEILRKKIEVGSYAAIIGTERVQIRYIELLRGLMHDDASQRWGTEEIFSWLDGTRLTPPALARRRKANRPFLFRNSKYLFADTLALELMDYPSDALKVVESGDLGQWVEKAFNEKELSEHYASAMDKLNTSAMNKENMDYIIMQVVFALNPMLPVRFKGRSFTYDGIGGLMARSCYEDQDLSVFIEVLQKNILDQAASFKTISQSEILNLIKVFDSCRTMLRQKKRGLSVEKCVYSLCYWAPCFSPHFKNYFVYDAASCLRSFEDLCAKGGQIAILMDDHCMAFFSVHEGRLIERVMYDLQQSNKYNQIAGNLRFLSMLQKKVKIDSLPQLAKVFASSLSGVYEVYKNLKLRQQVVDGVNDEAKKGNLVGMSGLIDNYVVRQRDAKAFEIARQEYRLLQKEYDQYNRRLANKHTYGVVNGQEAASLVSWIVATVITVMCVFAYLSGYQIF